MSWLCLFHCWTHLPVSPRALPPPGASSKHWLRSIIAESAVVFPLTWVTSVLTHPVRSLFVSVAMMKYSNQRAAQGRRASVGVWIWLQSMTLGPSTKEFRHHNPGKNPERRSMPTPGYLFFAFYRVWEPCLGNGNTHIQSVFPQPARTIKTTPTSHRTNDAYQKQVIWLWVTVNSLDIAWHLEE